MRGLSKKDAASKQALFLRKNFIVQERRLHQQQNRRIASGVAGAMGLQAQSMHLLGGGKLSIKIHFKVVLSLFAFCFY